MRLGKWVAVGLVLAATATAADPPKDGFPKFKAQEIATDLKIGYAVLIADINADKRPDIVVVDQHRVVWYENPSWKVRTILQGKTKPDNVCIAALDIDGGGDLELVLGAGWRPADTKTPGTLQWLKRGKSLDDEWALHPIPCDEPTVHRVRAADLDGDGKPEVIVAPLQGRECTAKGNWTDGRPVRIVAYKVPTAPTDPKAWKSEVISDELHVVHNCVPYPGGGLLTASYEGVHSIHREKDGKWKATLHGLGDQTNPKGARGSSEVRRWTERDKDGRLLSVGPIATIEPWHGNQVVGYFTTDTITDRVVIDSRLRWGHAVWFADLNGDGMDDLIVGVRDDPNPKLGDKFTDRRGVRIYMWKDPIRRHWTRHILENGGVAVEDLAVGDLNGDGKPDIVAVGRATGNCRIYWNQGK